MSKKKVHILGYEWAIEEQTAAENTILAENAGYCDWSIRTIVIRKDMDGNLGNMDTYMRKVIRHEIVHAFLSESGLNECAHESDCWALNEEMVDWIAKMGSAIYKAWDEVGATEEG